jgi:alpha-L-arabinofuranosidase B-like protein
MSNFPPFPTWPPLPATNQIGTDASALLYERAISTHWAGLYSVYRRLNRGYAGPLMKVRRASDNLTAYIFTSADGADTADVAALISFCAGTNGFVAQVYNQSPAVAGIGNAGLRWDMLQSTAANQPKIFDSVTGPILNAGGKLAMSFDGISQCLTRPDALGFQTGQAFYLGIAASNVATNQGYLAWVGSSGGAARQYLSMRRGADATHIILSDQQDATFALAGNWANSQYYQIEKIANGNISQVHAFEGSTDLGVNGAAAAQITFLDQSVSWGCQPALASFQAMKSNVLIIGGTTNQPDASDQTAINAALALHI